MVFLSKLKVQCSIDKAIILYLKVIYKNNKTLTFFLIDFEVGFIVNE